MVNYVGNNQKIQIPENNTTMKVIGNSCKISIEKNNGEVGIIGNNCTVDVRKGEGRIKYVGNFGRINLGRDSQKQNVTYCGNNGQISKYERSVR